MDVAALGAIERVRLELDLQIQVASLAAADAATSLTGEPNLLALGDAGGDAHVQRACLLPMRPCSSISGTSRLSWRLAPW
jgi:hypothetical protein